MKVIDYKFLIIFIKIQTERTEKSKFSEVKDMHKINPLMYPDFISIADIHKCGKVYPLSIAEGIQDGEIFTNSMKDYGNVLFWSQSGFAYISGKVDRCFLEEIYELMLDRNKSNSRRFLLLTSDEYIEDYFMSKDDVILEKRYLFNYSGNGKFIEPSILVGYELKEIDNLLWLEISGKIVPSLFWKDANDFLLKGKGYCIICGNDIASWAFSAAISSEEIDIGIETNPKYRQQGLGMLVAKKMIQYTIEQGKKPVWACHYKNIASEGIAEKLGFIKVSECSIIKRND